MALLIDGYNLLHASGILGRGVGPGGLERSRLALLNFVAERVELPVIGEKIKKHDDAEQPDQRQYSGGWLHATCLAGYSPSFLPGIKYPCT